MPAVLPRATSRKGSQRTRGTKTPPEPKGLGSLPKTRSTKHTSWEPDCNNHTCLMVNQLCVSLGPSGTQELVVAMMARALSFPLTLGLRLFHPLQAGRSLQPLRLSHWPRLLLDPDLLPVACFDPGFCLETASLCPGSSPAVTSPTESRNPQFEPVLDLKRSSSGSALWLAWVLS